jgi:hypothetical protein
MANLKEYKNGDIVWYVDDHKIVCSEIVCVILCERPLGYDYAVTKQNLRDAYGTTGKLLGIRLHLLFPTKEALLEDLEKNIDYDRDEYGRLVFNGTKEE